ncbi:MAG: EamA family transporter [Spirochaetales bacterium]|nr:EamA family transporter [Spirochaetales bacterium]
MYSYIWPVFLVVMSNILYQISAKEVPEDINPFASLTVTYIVGALFSSILYFMLSDRKNLIAEYKAMNFAPFLLGLVIVGLEIGSIYAYKAGWKISIFSIVQSAFLAIALLMVGSFLYHEALSWNKLVGIAICLLGLLLINLK